MAAIDDTIQQIADSAFHEQSQMIGQICIWAETAKTSPFRLAKIAVREKVLVARNEWWFDAIFGAEGE